MPRYIFRHEREMRFSSHKWIIIVDDFLADNDILHIFKKSFKKFFFIIKMTEERLRLEERLIFQSKCNSEDDAFAIKIYT